MSISRLKVACAAALFLLILWSPTRARGADAPQFLLISDIHFDPFMDKSLFNDLVERPDEEWSGILAKSQPPGVSPAGQDSNYALLKSTLDEARKQISNPDFILYPGDFLCHGWQSKYDALAKQPHLDNPVAYREFTAKVIRFLANEFRERYPETPIFPVMGNDDSLCGDYMLTPNGPFLKMFAAVWGPLVGHADSAIRGEFRRTFSVGGNYSLKLPGLENHRIIGLGSVFFSVKYNNACGSNLQTPATDQLHWLSEELQKAQEANEKVWLLMHVPPGLNGYSTAKSVKTGAAAVTFWQPALTSNFVGLLNEYQDTIQTAFAGHTHMDDYRLIRIEGRPKLVTKIAPGVSPIFGNNPGFQIYQYDRASGALQNFQTHYLNVLTTQGKPTPSADQRWALEYDFRQAYGLEAITPETISQLVDGIAVNPAIAKHYAKFYSLSGTPEMDATTIKAYRCVIPNVTPPEFHLCYTGIPKPKTPPAFVGRKVAAERD